MLGQIQQRDRPSPLRHRHSRRKVSRGRVVERDLAALHHISEQKSGEDFGDGSNLEKGFTGQRLTVDRTALTVCDDAPAARLDDADHNSSYPVEGRTFG